MKNANQTPNHAAPRWAWYLLLPFPLFLLLVVGTQSACLPDYGPPAPSKSAPVGDGTMDDPEDVKRYEREQAEYDKKWKDYDDAVARVQSNNRRLDFLSRDGGDPTGFLRAGLPGRGDIEQIPKPPSEPPQPPRRIPKPSVSHGGGGGGHGDGKPGGGGGHSGGGGMKPPKPKGGGGHGGGGH